MYGGSGENVATCVTGADSVHAGSVLLGMWGRSRVPSWARRQHAHQIACTKAYVHHWAYASLITPVSLGAHASPWAMHIPGLRKSLGRRRPFVHIRARVTRVCTHTKVHGARCMGPLARER